MARKRKTEAPQKHIEQYEHKDKERLNNPPVGLVDAHTDTDNGGSKRKTYQYDQHLDPHCNGQARLSIPALMCLL